MDRAMIVSGSEKSLEELCSILKTCGINQISIINNCAESRRSLVSGEKTVIIINTPLTDEFGTAFALHATRTNAGIIMLVRSELAEDIACKVENDGVIVVAKPLQKSALFQAVRLAISMNRRIMGVKNENLQLQRKLEEMKVIDRAKCLLIQCLSMTESQAHRFIEKQAMDMRISKTAVAEGILKTYES